MALWTPADLTTPLSGWWDGQDSASITLSAGKVSSWGNKGSTGLAATQGTAATQPVVNATGISGFPALSFSGAQRLNTTAMSLSASWTAAAVFSVTSTAATMSLFDGDDGGSNRVAQFLRTAAAKFESIAFNTAPAAFTASGGTLAANAPAIIIAVRGPSDLKVYVNGALIATTATTGTPKSLSRTVTIGARVTGTQPLNGLLGELDYAVEAMDDATRQKLEGYLAWKWGLASSLPADHPYKTAAPTTGSSAASATVTSATQGHTSTSPVLAAKFIVAVNGAAHSHSATAPALLANAPTFAAAVNSATHAHASTVPSLAAKSSASVASGVHSHTASVPAVAAKFSANANSASHAQSSTAPAIAAKSLAVVNGSSHSLTSSEPNLGTGGSLAIQSSGHAHTASGPALAARSTSAANGASHGLTSTSPTVAHRAAVAANDNVHGHAASTPTAQPGPARPWLLTVDRPAPTLVLDSGGSGPDLSVMPASAPAELALTRDPPPLQWAA